MRTALIVGLSTGLMTVGAASINGAGQVPTCFGQPATIVGTDHAIEADGTEVAMSSWGCVAGM
jgi:hypothetical protein